MTKSWQKHKGVITNLYQDQGLPLSEVMGIMKQNHSFNASTRAYRARFAKWGISKYKAPERIRIRYSDSAYHSPPSRFHNVDSDLPSSEPMSASLLPCPSSLDLSQTFMFASLDGMRDTTWDDAISPPSTTSQDDRSTENLQSSTAGLNRTHSTVEFKHIPSPTIPGLAAAALPEPQDAPAACGLDGPSYFKLPSAAVPRTLAESLERLWERAQCDSAEDDGESSLYLADSHGPFHSKEADGHYTFGVEKLVKAVVVETLHELGIHSGQRFVAPVASRMMKNVRGLGIR